MLAQAAIHRALRNFREERPERSASEWLELLEKAARKRAEDARGVA